MRTERTEAENRVSEADASDITAEQAFYEVFWPSYPRKTAKFVAFKAWKRLGLKDDDQETLDAIMAGLAHYVKNEWDLDQPRYIPLAATWLNQRRWEDIT